MKTIVAITFFLLILGSGPVSICAAAEAKISTLVGTTWSGPDSEGDHYEFTFEQNGTLAYKSPTGSFKNGKWKRSGAAVYMQMNNHFSEYLGEIKGDSMEGKAWNQEGRAWKWVVSKQN